MRTSLTILTEKEITQQHAKQIANYIKVLRKWYCRENDETQVPLRAELAKAVIDIHNASAKEDLVTSIVELMVAVFHLVRREGIDPDKMAEYVMFEFAENEKMVTAKEGEIVDLELGPGFPKISKKRRAAARKAGL